MFQRKPLPLSFVAPFQKLSLAPFGTLVVVLFLAVANAAVAAEMQPKMEDPLNEQQVQEFFERVRTLVLPQQEQWARELIRRHPDTPVAKQAQMLLDEYTRYNKATDEEQQRKQAHTKAIREFWDARRPAARKATVGPLEIINETDRPVLYQVKGPSMEWAGPHRLRAGQTHRFHYPVRYRRYSRKDLNEFSLSVGTRYAFRQSDEDGVVRLYRAGPQSNSSSR